MMGDIIFAQTTHILYELTITMFHADLQFVCNHMQSNLSSFNKIPSVSMNDLDGKITGCVKLILSIILLCEHSLHNHDQCSKWSHKETAIETMLKPTMKFS